MNCPGISPEGIVSLKTYLSDGIAFNNFGISLCFLEKYIKIFLEKNISIGLHFSYTYM